MRGVLIGIASLYSYFCGFNLIGNILIVIAVFLMFWDYPIQVTFVSDITIGDKVKEWFKERLK